MLFRISGLPGLGWQAFLVKDHNIHLITLAEIKVYEDMYVHKKSFHFPLYYHDCYKTVSLSVNMLNLLIILTIFDDYQFCNVSSLLQNACQNSRKEQIL